MVFGRLIAPFVIFLLWPPTCTLNVRPSLNLLSLDSNGTNFTHQKPMPKQLASDIVSSMRSFIAASSRRGRKRTVLVTLGDSTMGGLSHRLYEALHPVGGDMGLWSFSQCPLWGGNCKPFSEAPPLNYNLTQFEDVFDSIREASVVLDKSHCNFGGHIFLAHSYFNGSLIHYSWGFGAESFGACWKPCLTEAIKALQPTAVVVNQGLHLLHAYPYRSCAKTASPILNLSYFDCGKHEDFVTNVARDLRSVSPISIWKTSNWVCDKKYYGGWRNALDKWHDSEKRDALERACRKDCDAFGKDRPCGDELIDARSSGLQRDASMRAITRVRSETLPSDDVQHSSRLGTVDAYAATEGKCDATHDGRHYNSLDPEIAFLMSKELARLAEAPLE